MVGATDPLQALVDLRLELLVIPEQVVGLRQRGRAARAVGEDVETEILGQAQVAGSDRQPVELVL